MTKRFPGLPEREKMDWSTHTVLFINTFYLRVAVLCFQHEGVSLLSAGAVRAGLGQGQGWTHGQITLPCTKGVPPTSLCSLHCPVPHFLGFWPCQVQKCVFHRNSCCLKSSFSSLEREGRLLWLRADYLPNKMWQFFWVRRWSWWSQRAAWGLKGNVAALQSTLLHCWVIPASLVISSTITFLLDTADAQPIFCHRLTSF